MGLVSWEIGGGFYLDSGLGQVDAASQVLPDEGVGVVSPFKHSLQRLQLAAVEGSPVPALLPLLLLLRVHLLIWDLGEG